MRIVDLVRDNIKRLTPYSSARKEFSGAAKIFLDANENSFGSPLETNFHRYPDPLQYELKRSIAEYRGVQSRQIFIGNGSDEAIDLLFRIFCEPKNDNALICPPTYGMYEVSAGINDISLKRARLTDEFQLDFREIYRQIDEQTKLVFFCSPNNPTGNSMSRNGMLDLAGKFNGIVVIDEAYVDFSNEKSLVNNINNFPNLVILQTFSKAWGLAGLRVGLAFAHEEIINVFNKVKPPYNISTIVQDEMNKALRNNQLVERMIQRIVLERERLSNELKNLSFVTLVHPSDANFLLVRTHAADLVYNFLLSEAIVVRNRNTVELCEGCLRITVGTPDENTKLLESLKKYEKSLVY